MSLRARLLLGTALIAVVLGVAAVTIVRTTRSHLVDQVDAQLQSGIQQVDEGGGRGDPFDGPASATPPLSRYFVGVLTADGDLLVVPRLTSPDAPIPRLDERAVEALREGRTITVTSDDSDVDYRIREGIRLRGGRSMVIALPLDDVDEAVRRLMAVEAAAVLAVLGVLGLVMWWVIRLGVRPVQRMTETAGAIAAGDLSQRVPEGRPGTEAGDLGVALNGMLGRIEDAFDHQAASEARLRQFVADASHELRTPVATIRGYAELYRAGALGGIRRSRRRHAANGAGGHPHGHAGGRPAPPGPPGPGPPARASAGRPGPAGRRMPFETRRRSSRTAMCAP